MPMHSLSLGSGSNISVVTVFVHTGLQVLHTTSNVLYMMTLPSLTCLYVFCSEDTITLSSDLSAALHAWD